jgi:hypothetical protein
MFIFLKYTSYRFLIFLELILFIIDNISCLMPKVKGVLCTDQIEPLKLVVAATVVVAVVVAAVEGPAPLAVAVAAAAAAAVAVAVACAIMLSGNVHISQVYQLQVS